ncbi:hypothetical protein MLD38_013055 [Melastoma candidum]|uniref:Uncharacterized protein n=1 Tax=Melastoma candidum TaxID=119954 RepID=A0ACB9R7R3_9MYRT|nr:hypothetical protein MLD38_013055 [Melastoma candidum]
MSFRSMDSRPPPSPNLRLQRHHHRRFPPSHQDPPANYRISSSPYQSPHQPPPPSLFSSEPYPPRSIPPPPLPQPPNPNYYRFSFPDAPTHHPLCSVSSNFQYFPPAARNREGIAASTEFSRIGLDQDLRPYSGRVERGPTFVSPARPEELLRSGTACYGGYDSSCSSRLYGIEVNRRSHELDSVGDGLEFRVGNVGCREHEFAGRFSNERHDDSCGSRCIGCPDKSYDVTLVKQVQKRSAFSRLQMPKVYHSPRKFDREWCFGSVYDDKNRSSQLRCKAVLLCPELAVKDSKNGDPVDLNVSFKSNSLVAKPVDPPSSSTFVLDDDSPPNAKRLRSSELFDMESDCLLLRNKFEEDLQRPNRTQSTVTEATGSRVVPNRGSPSKFNRPNNLMASIKDSSKLPVKKDIEQGTRKSNGFSVVVASSGLVKKETRVEEGIVAAGFGGNSHSNKNAVKTELRNSTDETRKFAKILNTDNAYPVAQLKAGALSIGKDPVTGPEQSVGVIRNKVAVPESDKKYGSLNKDDASVTNCELGKGKGEGGKFKMVLKANKTRPHLKIDNVLVKKSDTGNGKEEGAKVEILVSADQADGNSQSSIKVVSVREGSTVGPTSNVSEPIDGIVFSDSGERDGQLNKTSFSVADCQVISETSDVGEPKNVTKAEKSTYSGSEKGNLVVKRRVAKPEFGKKPGCSNEYDVLASNSEVGMGPGKFESWGAEKVFKADNVCADQILTTEAVPMRKVRNRGPKDVISCEDGELVLQREGTLSGGEAVDADLTSSVRLNNIPGNGTLGNLVNGMVQIDTLIDVSKSGLTLGQKKRKLSFSENRSRQTSTREHMGSLPNDNRIFSGRLPTTDEGARLSGIKCGPLSRVTLNVTELSCEKRGNTSLFDDANLLRTNNSVNNSLQIHKISNCVLLPGCSPVQNKLSERHKVGETKEGYITSRLKNDHNMEMVKIEEMDARASEKQDMGRCEMVLSNCSGEVHLHKAEKIKPHSPLGNLPPGSSFSTSIPCATGIEMLKNSDSSNELVESESYSTSDRISSEETEICLRSKVSICRTPLEQFPPQIMDNNSNEQTGKPTVQGLPLNADNHPVAHDIPFNSNSAKLILKDFPILEKPLHLPREDFRSSNLCQKGAGLPVEPKPCIPEQRAFPVRSSFISRTSKHSSSTTNCTWHRTSNLSAFVPGMQPSANVLPMKRNFSGANGKILDSSYVRKGNSLVRKPMALASHFVQSAVQKSTSSVKLEAENKNGYGKPINSSGYMKLFVSEGTVSSSERPSPPSGASSKNTFVSSEKLSTCSSAGSLVNIADVPTANTGQGSHLGFSSDDAVDSQSHRDQVNSANRNDMKIVSSNKILYVKLKSNKLVATKSLLDQAKVTESNKALTSSGYFKRKRNQLVRSSLGNSFSPVTSVHPVDAASEDHGTTQGLMPSWKCYQMVIPQLFPWKRPSYRRKLMKTSIGLNGRTFTASSQKLELLRKRDAVYTRSKHGLSLRRSKILSIGGASLKWSKSIERRSKKVNEEATRAVLEAQIGKREQKASTSSKAEKENNDSRGRIFRIGSQRYMMDPSRRTLQRLPDDESSKPTASETKKLLKKLYVPRRLLIGNDEYVRIGNGNQLIRNPKRRSRLLASEKVRWSLHTARQRLAKKKKYCQFFTRFGKCNKDDGKCPYIHDPSKIAVCTKFLNDLCSNKDCKLTHKIIPERMPDCSFFLQGLCANKNCPYRHVNVNPKAPTCEAFLRGYCMDGNECRKKHSYVCPVFGATGNCPQGSKCKFHHPKVPIKGKKRKRSREKKNGQDRYFGNMSRTTLEPGASITEKPLPVTHGETLDLPGFISLGSSDDETGDGGGIGDGTSDPLDLPCGDIDGLIKPLGVRELDLTTS